MGDWNGRPVMGRRFAKTLSAAASEDEGLI
jgi:hypothetical protein